MEIKTVDYLYWGKVEGMAMTISEYRLINGIGDTPLDGPVVSGKHYSVTLSEKKY